MQAAGRLRAAAAALRRHARVSASGAGGAGAAGAVGALAAGAGAVALAVWPAPSRCYYEPGPDGHVDRLARWATKSWSIKSGSSPGFHLKTVNPLLEKHMHLLRPATPPKADAPTLSVLVPLCGKSIDMPFLCEQGFRVVGVEGVLRPILELRAEHRQRLKGFKARKVLSHGADGWAETVDFQPAEAFQGRRPGYVFTTGDRGLGYYADSPAIFRGTVRAGNRTTVPFEILQGDMFQVTPELIRVATYEERGQFDAIYDRSSLVAIPPSAREEYAATLGRLLLPGGRLLLVVLDYDQALVPIDPTGRRWSPPPFSVPDEEVRRLFPQGQWTIEVVDRQAETDLPAGNPSFHGVAVSETVYVLTKRQPRATASPGWSAAGRIAVAGIAVALAAAGVVSRRAD